MEVEENDFCNPHTLKQCQEAISEGQDSHPLIDKLIRNVGLAKVVDECQDKEDNNLHCTNEKLRRDSLMELPLPERPLYLQEIVVDEEEETAEQERIEAEEGYENYSDEENEGEDYD